MRRATPGEPPSLEPRLLLCELVRPLTPRSGARRRFRGGKELDSRGKDGTGWGGMERGGIEWGGVDGRRREVMAWDVRWNMCDGMAREGMGCGGAAGRRRKGETRNVNGRGGKRLDSRGKDGTGWDGMERGGIECGGVAGRRREVMAWNVNGRRGKFLHNCKTRSRCSADSGPRRAYAPSGAR